MALIPKNYARLESGYREKALKIYPWVCGCLFCHDHEHSKYTEADQYGTTVVAGEDAQKDVGVATFNPFADLKAMMDKKK
ncbi:MAG: hypothetical protein E6099_06410 [Enterobacter sp.]|nr:hypothetical protein [Enterobacter sp.]